jgi:hypothetical protein
MFIGFFRREAKIAHDIAKYGQVDDAQEPIGFLPPVIRGELGFDGKGKWAGIC